MDAVISGRAGLALVDTDGGSFAIHIDCPDVDLKSGLWIGNRTLANADDLIYLSADTRGEIVSALSRSWANDRALLLTLLILNPEEDHSVKGLAVDALDELFDDNLVLEYVKNSLYSSPLPPNVDVTVALNLTIAGQFEKVNVFLYNLIENQVEIAQRRIAWDELPFPLFGSTSAKSESLSFAISHGMFRRFVELRDKHGLGVLENLSIEPIRGNSQWRTIITSWAADFQRSTPLSNYREFTDHDDYAAQIEPARLNGYERSVIFAKVERQRYSIKQELSKGNVDIAKQYIDQLVILQRNSSTPEQLAKSLCDLAQSAKDIGSPTLQLELGQRALEECPGDGWSYAVCGDALRSLHRYEDALESYQNARINGQERVALVGLAEISKDLGRLDEAISMLQDCSLRFPADLVCRNAKASALADFGHFQQALEEYDVILRTQELDQVTLCGKASVLRDMGRYDESIGILNDVIRDFGVLEVPVGARAETYREIGRYDLALDDYHSLIRKFPMSPMPRNGIARLLRDMGRFSESMSHFAENIKQNGLDSSAHLGLADTLRKAGNIEAALAAYDNAISKFRTLSSAKYGKAALLSVQGNFEDAAKLLPSYDPASLSDWVAYHIRGMIELRRSNFVEAERIFVHGIENSPWRRKKDYFRTSLALLKIRQSDTTGANITLGSITTPALIMTVDTLRFHTHCIINAATDVYMDGRYLDRNVLSYIRDLQSDILTTFSSSYRRTEEDSLHRLFVKECEAILLAA